MNEHEENSGGQRGQVQNPAGTPIGGVRAGGEHARTLSGEFWCSLCNLSFDSEEDLLQHNRERHASEQPPPGPPGPAG
jgi:hypothetical protein